MMLVDELKRPVARLKGIAAKPGDSGLDIAAHGRGRARGDSVAQSLNPYFDELICRLVETYWQHSRASAAEPARPAMARTRQA